MNRPDPSAAAGLVEVGRFFHGRGWVPATGGNFSTRADGGTIAITASGCHKGELTEADIILADLEGRSLDPKRKSSYETLLHCQVYKRLPECGAVLHTHSVANTVLSRRLDRVNLAGYELLKVLDGITSHDATATIPVFDNEQDIARLAAAVDGEMQRGGARHGYLIRGHGLYAWGPTLAAARHRVEALEFMFECEMRSTP
ncbi:MAG TPA: methylthioribulose 1-phosphate dehydratase [Nevskiaceae bacterium]|nr:methylthioribulose 1-phosphate dehydratase [Nevskiaceae bacterium]